MRTSCLWREKVLPALFKRLACDAKTTVRGNHKIRGGLIFGFFFIYLQSESMI